MAHVKQGEFGEHPMGQHRAEPVREGVETMHPASQNIEGEDIVRAARIDEGAEAGRNDRLVRVIWSAGFFDGEGSICISSNGAGRNSQSLILRIAVAQVVEAPLLILHALYGGSLIACPSTRKRARAYWQWACASRVAADAVSTMLPYLVNKREQAELALEFQKMKVGRSNGQRLTALEVEAQHDYRQRLKNMHWGL